MSKLSNSGKAFFGVSYFGTSQFCESVKPMIHLPAQVASSRHATADVVQVNEKFSSNEHNLFNMNYTDEDYSSLFTHKAKKEETLNIGNDVKLNSLDDKKSSEYVNLKKQYQNVILKKNLELEDVKQKMEFLKTANENKIKEMEVCIEESSKLKLESDKNRTELSRINSEYNEVSIKISRVSGQINFLQENIVEINRVKTFIENDNYKLKQNSEEYVEMRGDQLNCQAQQISNEIEAKTEQLEELKNKYDQLEHDNQELSNQLSKVNTEFDLKKNEFSDAKQSVFQENKELKENFVHANYNIDQAEAQFKSLNTESENFQKEITRLVQIEREKGELDSFFESLQRKHDQLESEKICLFDSKELLVIQLSQIEQKNVELNESILSFQNAIEKNQMKMNEFHSAIDCYQKNIDELELFKQKSIEDIAKLEEQVDQRKLLNAQLNDHNEVLKIKQIELDSERTELSVTIEHLQCELQEKLKANCDITEDLNVFKAVNENLEVSSLKLEEENSSLTDVLKEFYSHEEDLKSKNQNLSDEMLRLQLEAGNLREQLNANSEAVEESKKKCDNLENQLEVMQQSQEAFKFIHDRLNKMADSEEKYEKLIAEKDEIINQLNFKNDEFKAEIEKIQREKEMLNGNFQDMLTLADQVLSTSGHGVQLAKLNSQQTISANSDYEKTGSTLTKTASEKTTELKAPELISSSTRKRRLSTGGSSKRGAKTARSEESNLPRFEAKTAEYEKGVDMSFIKSKLDKEKQPDAITKVSTATRTEDNTEKKASDEELDWFDDLFA